MEHFQIHIHYQDSISMIDLEKILRSIRTLYAYQMSQLFGKEEEQFTDTLRIKTVREGSIILECLCSWICEYKEVMQTVGSFFQAVKNLIDIYKFIRDSLKKNQSNHQHNKRQLVEEDPVKKGCRASESYSTDNANVPPRVKQSVADLIAICQDGVNISIKGNLSDKSVAINIDKKGFHLDVNPSSPNNSN